jgi:DNA-binding CsgD family transcriptional regulator
VRGYWLSIGYTKRQAEILELLPKGLRNKEMANILNVSEKTVKFHMGNLYKKMNVQSRPELMAKVMRPLPTWDLMQIDLSKKTN